MKHDFNITSCLVEHEGKFLIVGEDGRGRGGLYNFPGGHIDDLETLAEAAVREVKEESGYEVELTGVLGVYQSIYNEKQLNVGGPVFVGKLVGGEATTSAAHPEVRWVTADELRQLVQDGKVWTKYPIVALEDYLRRGAYPLELVSSLRY